MTENKIFLAVIAMTTVFIAVFAFTLLFFARSGIFNNNNNSNNNPQPPNQQTIQPPNQPPNEETSQTPPPPPLPPPDPNELTDFLSNFPYRVSVFYHNIKNDFIFAHREEVIYSTASLNKALHAFYIYHLAELGAADLNQTHIYKAGQWRGGTGVIRHMPFGTEFTHFELLRHSVRDSDNIAFFELLNIYSSHSPSYREFYASLGGNTDFIRSISNHFLSAAEAALMMLHIYNYIQTDTVYANHFHHSLLNSDVPIIQSDHPTAQKYGHWEGAFHDMAIVHSPSPYILVIMSDMFTTAPFHAFEEISLFIQDFNNKYFITE